MKRYRRTSGSAQRSGVFGSGRDGNLRLDGTSHFPGFELRGKVYSATRDIEAMKIRLSRGVVLNPNGWRVSTRHTLSFGHGRIWNMSAQQLWDYLQTQKTTRGQAK